MSYRDAEQTNGAPSDAELATKLRDTGDAESFRLLIQRHGSLLYSFLARLSGARAQALLPLVLDRLRDRSYAIRDVSSFHLWGLGVVSSIWREESKEESPPAEDLPAGYRAVHKIAHHLRPVFILVHYFQMPLDDVAFALRIPRGTAASRLQDAFASLASLLAPALPPPIPVQPPTPETTTEALKEDNKDDAKDPSKEAIKDPPKEAPQPEAPKSELATTAVEPKTDPTPEPEKPLPPPMPVIPSLAALIPKISTQEETPKDS